MYYRRHNPHDSSDNSVQQSNIHRQSIISIDHQSSLYAPPPNIERQLNSLAVEDGGNTQEYAGEVLQQTFDQLDEESLHQPSIHESLLHNRPNSLHPSMDPRATSPAFNSSTTDSASNRSSIINDNYDIGVSRIDK